MFHRVPKSVLLASLLGLIPILMGLASTFNIGLRESLKDELIRIAIIYSGFILSFMGIAFVAGKIAENRREFPAYVTASFAGLAVNYVIGVTWMYAALSLWAGEGAGISYTAAWASMIPFLVKDGALAFVAAVAASRLEGSFLKNTRLRQKQASSL